jgi:hypothetical protein
MDPRAHDSEWTDKEAEGQPELEDQPPGYDADTAQEGSFPPRDHPIASDDWGTTPRERRIGEPLSDRVRREQPDVERSGQDGAGVRTAQPPSDDVEPEEEQPPPGASAEEAAMRVERG